MPVLFDRECDQEIPDLVFCAWKETGKPRAIRRALTVDERDKVHGRWIALRAVLIPFSQDQRLDVEAQVAAMVGGFRAMRQEGESAADMVEILVGVLRDCPLWAIAEACLRIARGQAGLDKRYAPNDAQIYEVVNSITELHRLHFRNAELLLLAEVEDAIPMRSAHRSVPRVGDGQHAQRIAADLAERRARNQEKA